MQSGGGDLPTELDFFKYAQGGPTQLKLCGRKREHSEEGETRGRKRKREGDFDDVKSEGDNMPAQRHKVTSKGSNVPEPMQSFEELRDRYQLQSYLISNLTKNGFSYPTGIQSHGIPILLEVRRFVMVYNV
jgi:ATP-dependent RNA helicase DDX52/ROK1